MEVGFQHLHPARQDLRGHQHATAAGRLAIQLHGQGHAHSLHQRGGAVVEGGVGQIQARQFRHQGLELENGLQRALTHFRLIRRIRGDELAAQGQVFHRFRQMAHISPAAQVAILGSHRLVGGGHGAEVPVQGGLAHGRFQLQGPA